MLKYIELIVPLDNNIVLYFLLFNTYFLIILIRCWITVTDAAFLFYFLVVQIFFEWSVEYKFCLKGVV